MLLTSLLLTSLYLAALHPRHLLGRNRGEPMRDAGVTLQGDEPTMTIEHNADFAGAEGDKPRAKISAEFAARLQRLDRHEQIRVIVLARTAATGPDEGVGEQQAQAATGATRMMEAFRHIDACLAETEGRRLTEWPNHLGHVVVETNRPGIEALAELACVEAILEDQAIYPHRPVNHPAQPRGGRRE